MNTLWKGIEKIYNFRVKGLPKSAHKNHKMQSICYYPRSITAAESTKRNQDPGENGLDTIPSRKKMLVPPLLA
jgi:hypothetical protein